jgi:hypothetical protein
MQTGQLTGRILGVERQRSALTLSEDDRRVLAVWAAGCAERTLSLFEAQAPSDTRPRDAIDGLRAFRSWRNADRKGARAFRHARTRRPGRSASRPAREIGDPAAVVAARAAGHAAAVAHMAAHARGVVYAAKAAGLAAPHDPTAVADEIRWQVNHASPTVRDALRRLPAPNRSAGALGALISDMHTKLTTRGWRTWSGQLHPPPWRRAGHGARAFQQGDARAFQQGGGRTYFAREPALRSAALLRGVAHVVAPSPSEPGGSTVVRDHAGRDVRSHVDERLDPNDEVVHELRAS